ncbi:NUDIX domain-containing protein [Niveispirillum cyanobacteriorum]|uniref:GDP-mannose pyrophosphatase n=1 Tax=Niveispirillum cyanobacteriorum TaxID=1612173 RepID=A0A2K9NBG9_9PROT|nr:NUDIX hydrolase [Niveispirillum cyanobacteriorum]AUN29525.1 DNA mismatch repair protein MutT [Niveispirillum cyanobacteriorum]GGE63552.1 DNA mismatch repair protein MutT [Niveispirillum cyanobacteriorum]
MRNDDPDANPWRTLTRRPVYENPWIRVDHHEVLKPSGDPGIYGLVHFQNHAVGVVPVAADGTTWLVGQYRYPLNRYSWEIPEGGVPAGEDPTTGARRELREETGLTAACMIPIIPRVALSNSVSDEEGTLYVAWDLTEGEAEPDDTEQLRLRRLPLRTALDMALSGEITDSLSLLALLRLPLLLKGADTPADLRAALVKGLG